MMEIFKYLNLILFPEIDSDGSGTVDFDGKVTIILEMMVFVWVFDNIENSSIIQNF